MACLYPRPGRRPKPAESRGRAAAEGRVLGSDSDLTPRTFWSRVLLGAPEAAAASYIPVQDVVHSLARASVTPRGRRSLARRAFELEPAI